MVANFFVPYVFLKFLCAIKLHAILDLREREREGEVESVESALVSILSAISKNQ